MTLDDADDLLIKWAVWCQNELAKLEASKSRWQMDYRPDWNEESAESHIEPGDDLQMLDVDTALAMVKMNQPRYHMILVGRYRHGVSYPYMQLDAAKRAFITEFISPLDSDTIVANNSFRGRSCL